MTALLEAVAKELQRRDFTVVTCATKEEARDLILAKVQSASVVGMGGCMTMRDLGVTEALQASGKTMVRDANCDVFLSSANALTADGRIVNIDGNGNRVAATISGAKEVIFAIGRNKLVEGGIDDAIARIRRCACPPNGRRLGRQTPCALTGKCVDCNSPDRMCKVTVIMDRRPTHTPTTVYLIDAELGF